ncbi:MAG TPA: peptidoglycan DD-metalloendopeptidase family protein [Gallionella sp.]
MLTQNLSSQNLKRRKLRKNLRWVVALSTLPLLGVVTAFGLVPQNDFGLTSAQLTIQEIALPDSPATHSASSSSYWHNDRVRRGDTVNEILRRLEIEDEEAGAYLRESPDVASFRKLAVGSELRAETTAEGNLIALRYLNDEGVEFIIQKQGSELTVQTLPATLEKRLFVRTGEILTTLYAATDAAGLPDAAASQLNELFSGDIDFHHDLRKGDKFTVVYEMTYNNGALLNTGRIQAAEFINQGKVYRAIYFEKDAKHGDYYTPDGKSVRKAFLRSPITYSRVSSGFTNSRFHPVLKKWRSHMGVDFAAPTGTKVKATADGLISFVGKDGGYGNVVKISHQGQYLTVYGHLSRFAANLRKGQRVTQGQVIGYVGQTGLASGPHLHYEFKVHGKSKNPMRIALPEAKPIEDADRAAFEIVSDNLAARLNLLRNTNLAMLD